MARVPVRGAGAWTAGYCWGKPGRGWLPESLQRQNQGDLWGTERVFVGEGWKGHDSKGFSLSNWEKGSAF